MFENRFPISANFEPPRTDGADGPWIELRGKRILVVEDQEPVRACLRLMLEMEGHQVTEAGNGVEALNLFALGHFDLVLTDFEMPLMKGDALAVRLKQLAPSLPLLMISASAWARRDASNPVDGVLDKPFTARDLRNALRQVLSSPGDPAPSSIPTLENPAMAMVEQGRYTNAKVIGI